MLTEIGQAKPRGDPGEIWMLIDACGWGRSQASSLDGAIPGTLEEDDACSLNSGIKGEVTYFSPGSYLYAFKLRGKHRSTATSTP